MYEGYFEDIQQLLKKHGQSHILAFLAQLDVKQRQHLLQQIRSLHFDKIDRLVEYYIKNPFSNTVNADLNPAASYKPNPDTPEQAAKYTLAIEKGKELISRGKVAAFLVAGGQGTRLGFDGPKGDFPISPVKNKTFFEIFAEQITAVSAKYHTTCPWYIMTSPLNYKDTIEIFQKSDYYGLGKENVQIFQQGTIPNFDTDGKILLADKATISSSPDGHGGCLEAIHRSGLINNIKERGIEILSYFQVDNPLINIFDPLFIGLHVLDNAEMSSKALSKTDPQEKVGVLCLADNKISVIEYSDLPEELANKQDSGGNLLFNLASIGIHLINRTFIDKFNEGGFSLPLHKAVKQIQHVDENGRSIESEGIKLEHFVFDALGLASNSIILQTLRCEEFAPTKNATGTDSIETTKSMMVERAAIWLESAGVAVPRKPDGSADCLLEIAPSFALYKEDVKSRLKQIPPIKPKYVLYLE